ncbi:hypothetical protein SEVIR_7G005852v4 [Setaria viridis]
MRLRARVPHPPRRGNRRGSASPWSHRSATAHRITGKALLMLTSTAHERLRSLNLLLSCLACPTPACSVSSEIIGTIVGNSNSKLSLPCLMQQHQRAASVSVEGSEQIPEHHLVQVIPPSRDAYSCLGHVNYAHTHQIS